MNHDHDSHENRPRNSITNWVLIGFLAIGGFFLITEHRAHLFGILPFLLLLACPLMHLFHHSGHGGHRRDDGEARGDERRDKSHAHQGH